MLLHIKYLFVVRCLSFCHIVCCIVLCLCWGCVVCPCFSSGYSDVCIFNLQATATSFVSVLFLSCCLFFSLHGCLFVGFDCLYLVRRPVRSYFVTHKMFMCCLFSFAACLSCVVFLVEKFVFALVFLLVNSDVCIYKLQTITTTSVSLLFL